MRALGVRVCKSNASLVIWCLSALCTTDFVRWPATLSPSRIYNFDMQNLDEEVRRRLQSSVRLHIE